MLLEPIKQRHATNRDQLSYTNLNFFGCVKSNGRAFSQLPQELATLARSDKMAGCFAIT